MSNHTVLSGETLKKATVSATLSALSNMNEEEKKYDIGKDKKKFDKKK